MINRISNWKKLSAKSLRAIVLEANEIFIFLLGVIVGLSLSYLIYSSGKNETLERAIVLFENASSLLQEFDSKNNNSEIMMMGNFNGSTMEMEEQENITSISAQLYNNTRVLCWVMTRPAYHKKRAIHVKKTWGRRCNKLLFFSSEEDSELDVIKIPSAGDGRKFLWIKVREAFKYIYENHFDDADWFMKTDDDSYVILENLRHFLFSYSTDAPVYFGCKFREIVKQGYMSGGSGYVLSKEALRRFVLDAYPNKELCPQVSPNEDWTIGKCLQNVGVAAGDTRDENHRNKFMVLSPVQHLTLSQAEPFWYWNYIFYPSEDKLKCCSNYVISFHYVEPDRLYELDYLIYGVKVVGLSKSIDVLPPKYDTEKLVEKWRKEKSNNTLPIINEDEPTFRK